MSTTAKERFEKYVNKEGMHVDGMALRCWEWTGALDNQGHPRFHYLGASVYAKRVGYLIDGVPIGPEDHVVTLCRNKACVRPEHHVLGSASEARKFSPQGECCPGSVYLARKLFRDGEADVAMIAECFGIGQHIAEAIIAEEALL